MSVIIRSREQFDRWAQFATAKGFPLEVSAGPVRKERSNPQNRMLWAMYAPIAEAMGFDVHDLHEWFCGSFWGWKDKRIPKTPRNPERYVSVPVRSTTRDENGKRSVMDKAEFARFLDLVERTAAQAGVYVHRDDYEVAA